MLLTLALLSFALLIVAWAWLPASSETPGFEVEKVAVPGASEMPASEAA